MTTIMALVWFPEEDEIREVKVEVIPSNKVLRGQSGLPLDRGPPSYRLHGYNLEPANSPKFAFIARRAPAF